LGDRIPWHIGSGPRARNRRIAEVLFLKTYDLELAQTPESKIWAYREAASVVDDWPDDLADVHQARGEAALRALPGIGASIGQQVAGWLQNDA
jgi:DNA polymerase/3'-5' exonuclease PolX